jgi:two-component system cell cycle response regulator
VDRLPTVMVVDDQPMSREATARVLRDAGFRVVPCADGQEAIARALIERPDAVVLDVVMPGMGGPEVCRALKRNAMLAGEFLPVLFLSSRTEASARFEGLRAGAEDYLGKPCEPEELRVRVEVLVRTRQAVSDLIRVRLRSAPTGDETNPAGAIDPVTGLYDQRYLTQRLDEEFQRAERAAEPLSLMALDLDQFDAVNSRYGRAAGDRLLGACGRAIARSCRDKDVVTHPAGDEFVVILPGSHFAAALGAAERVWRAVKGASIVEQGNAISCEASIGVACFPSRDVAATRDLLRYAHTALTRAKAEGRGRICLYQYQGYLLQPQ